MSEGYPTCKQGRRYGGGGVVIIVGYAWTNLQNVTLYGQNIKFINKIIERDNIFV